MEAKLVIRERRVFDDGFIMEIVIWKVPTPVPPTDHGLKYRLFYGRVGERVIGYDNERGKGDHRHYGNLEEPYYFYDMGRLLDDFARDVEIIRGEKI